MVESLKAFDQTVFLFLNGLHCPFLDPVIFWGSGILTWMPLFIFLLYAVIRRYKWQTLWILLFAALMILVSDQLSNVFKEWVARPRPTHEPNLTGVHTVYGYQGGRFAFYSAHASNTMAIAIFLCMLLKNQYRYFTPLILLWVVFMSYTRIYLGVHYPGDIVAGWLAGGLIGWGTGTACTWFLGKNYM